MSKWLAPVVFLAALTAVAAPVSLNPFFQPGKIRALILSGRNNHDWRTTTPFLRKILTQTGRFDVRVVEEPSGINMNSVMPYDVIVLDYNGPRWGQTAENAVGSFVRTGKGLVVVHGASYAFGEMELLADHHKRTGLKEPPWPEYAEMIGASWTMGPPKSGHAPRHVFRVKLVDRAHPITNGMKESFATSDELYHNLEMKPGIHVLATAFDDPKIGGTGKAEPVLWTLRYGKGRVFHTTLGHDVAAMRSPGFVTTFARGAEWAATGKVTLPAEIEPEPPKKNPVRVEVVVGGHDFAPSFFKIFQDRPNIAANVVYQPAAYQRSKLNRTDVIVQYDMVQEISDQAKANLRNYLESGKGLVVLHHAIASYQDWPWWYEQVVGGRYILKGKGDPPSTFKEGLELFTKTVVKHPVTKGVPPMRIWDEAYKGMWISPKVQVLVRTNHPASDGPVAWISPYRKARVVYIQLGHGPEAHNHPDYQRLVRNAVLWVAGREP